MENMQTKRYRQASIRNDLAEILDKARKEYCARPSTPVMSFRAFNDLVLRAGLMAMGLAGTEQEKKD